MILLELRSRRGGWELVGALTLAFVVAIVVWMFYQNCVHADPPSNSRICCGNLRQIETAKEQWAIDHKVGRNAVAYCTTLCPHISSPRLNARWAGPTALTTSTTVRPAA